ncbi:NAD-dependent epimerase/dehydratase family protein [[Eubacterium] hominis]|uniref:polysaccharide biosynthesis C-terminal domain-containing protein n=1 Tax=[Eubacterium] hominis TaxID=2764325 RepID=UPI003A4D7EA9
MKILVTGAKGFVGRNLVETLKTIRDEKNKMFSLTSNLTLYEYDLNSAKEKLKEFCADCDFIVHLAGVNRPQTPSEFYEGNLGFTEALCSYLKEAGNKCPIMISSSIQAERDNDYGKSKKAGEGALLSFGKENGNPIYIYRFANLFGKWCRPNYNSVVATWCHNIAHGLDIQINDPSVTLPLCYIDDVVEEIIHCICGNPYIVDGVHYGVEKVYDCTLGDLANTIKSFKESRTSLEVINQADELTKKLYATYLSYLPEDAFSYPLKMNIDERGSFTEFLKTKECGQVSVNISKPGITKGNHWHHTKNEKFLVVSGTGLIQFRKIGEEKIIEYQVSGEKLEVVDIPTGYTHNIINVGDTDMVTIMWANEMFDPNKPDTYFEKILIN